MKDTSYETKRVLIRFKFNYRFKLSYRFNNDNKEREQRKQTLKELPWKLLLLPLPSSSLSPTLTYTTDSSLRLLPPT